MLLDGIEDPIVRFYRIEYAAEYHNLPQRERRLTSAMVRQRLGLPPRACAVVRLARYVARKLFVHEAPPK